MPADSYHVRYATRLNLEMGKDPNPARTNRIRTRTQDLPRTEPKPKCHGSYSVLSLNEHVDTFTHKRVILLYYLG